MAVKAEKLKTKCNKQEKREIEEEELKALQVINKLASGDENTKITLQQSYFFIFRRLKNDVTCFFIKVFL